LKLKVLIDEVMNAGFHGCRAGTAGRPCTLQKPLPKRAKAIAGLILALVKVRQGNDSGRSVDQ